jgi:protein TonB
VRTAGLAFDLEATPPRGATMFETSLLESTPLLHTRNRGPALISFAIQAAIVSTLILIPLLHPEVLPLAAPRLPLLAPRYTPPRPPPVQPARVQLVTTITPVPTPATQAPRIPEQAFRSEATPIGQPALPVGVNIGTTGPNPLSSLMSTAPEGIHTGVSGPPAAAPVAGPLHISTGVSTGHLLAPIQPVYPAIARISRTEGTVVIQAIISKSGRIESAHVLSGNPMLQAAALDAVRAARYQPFLLNNQPTEVETTISINFRLGS